MIFGLLATALLAHLSAAPPGGSALRAPILVPPSAHANPTAAPAVAFRAGAVTIADSTLAALAGELAERSSTFAGVLGSLSAGSTPVVIGTPEQVGRLLPAAATPGLDLPIAYTRALPTPGRLGGSRDPRIGAVAVVIDLAAYRTLYARNGRSDRLEQDLYVVLAHEIGGHALGWATSRRLLAGCLDPSPLDLALSPLLRGCAVDWENRIRAELGLEMRPAYLHLVYPSGQPHDEIAQAYATGQHR